jgi:uncharacterized protein with HEPN domain
MKDDRIYIEHILQSIDRINSYIISKDYQSFSDDFLTQDAVIRQLEVLGEATKRILMLIRILYGKRLQKVYPNLKTCYKT